MEWTLNTAQWVGGGGWKEEGMEGRKEERKVGAGEGQRLDGWKVKERDGQTGE